LNLPVKNQTAGWECDRRRNTKLHIAATAILPKDAALFHAIAEMLIVGLNK